MQLKQLKVGRYYQTSKCIAQCLALSATKAEFRDNHGNDAFWLSPKEVNYEVHQDAVPPAELPSPMFKVLESRILVVAKITYPPNRWTAYLGIVPGKCHDDEWQGVFDYGTTVDVELAKFLFPAFKDLPYDR